MVFGLISPGLFKKVLRLTREGSDCLASDVAGEVIVFLNKVFLNKVSVSSFPKKVIKFYKIIKIKVGKSSFINIICASGAYGPLRIIKYSIIGEISNLLLTAGIAELHLGNISLGK